MFNILLSLQLLVSPLLAFNLDRSNLHDVCGCDISSTDQIWAPSLGIQSVNPDTFQGLTNIRQINFDGNQLTFIDGNIFSGLFNLRVIDLQRNQLSSLSSNLFSSLSKLDQLWFWKNKITSLDLKFF